MLDEIKSWCCLILGIIILLYVVLNPVIRYSMRNRDAKFNDAVHCFNALESEQRELLLDQLLDPSAGARKYYVSHETLFREKAIAIQSIPQLLETILTSLTIASLISFGLYAATVCLHDEGYLLADSPLRFPFCLPWIVIMFVGWPFLAVSLFRLGRLKHSI